jgi:hypothetical protein
VDEHERALGSLLFAIATATGLHGQRAPVIWIEVLNRGRVADTTRANRPLRGLYTHHFTCCGKLLIRQWGRHTTNNALTHTVVHQLRSTSTTELKLVVS